MHINQPSDDKLKQLLHDELGYLPEGEGIDAMLERGELQTFQADDIVREMDRYCPDVFIVRDGIVRFTDMDSMRERTFAFALPGTIFMSKHSFVMRRPTILSRPAARPSCFG